MTDNLKTWDALCKSDPAHTKKFNRPGGFKGTSLKPIWQIKMMTEHFGPCGEGWGIGEPKFETIHCEKETLVYCTASIWHGERSNIIYGVGGDKARQSRSGGDFCDDEAFKKAFTDAVGNALKYLGVGGDIHMGQHDDDKYVDAMRREFAERDAPKITESQIDDLMAQMKARRVTTTEFLRTCQLDKIEELTTDRFDGARDWILKQNKEKEAA